MCPSERKTDQTPMISWASLLVKKTQPRVVVQFGDLNSNPKRERGALIISPSNASSTSFPGSAWERGALQALPGQSRMWY